MAMEYRTSCRAYMVWNYRQEIEDLNRASEQGWQLVRGGCFHSRFVKNPDLRFRYQMDWRNVEDMGRYVETFREQGWEYINSTFNGWHYFRKFYDPALKEEDYEIVTDRESLLAMRRRWSRMLLALGAAVLVYTAVCGVRAVRTPNLPWLLQILLLLAVCVFLLRGGWLMRDPDAGPRGGRGLLRAYFLTLLLGWAAVLVLLHLRPHFVTNSQTEELTEPYVNERWMDFEVYYPDHYYLDLDLSADAPFTFSIVNDAGETVYTVTGTEIHEEHIRLWLGRRWYWFSSSCSGAFELNVRLD